MKTNFYTQFFGKEVSNESLISEIKTQWKENGHLLREIQTLDVYLKPEEHKAYYAINGKQAGEISL